MASHSQLLVAVFLFLHRYIAVTSISTDITTTTDSPVTPIPTDITTTTDSPVTSIPTDITATTDSPVTSIPTDITTTTDSPVTSIPTDITTTTDSPVTSIPTDKTAATDSPVTPISTDITTTRDSPFAIRLENGLYNNSGRVGVYHDGQWGGVCDHSWNYNDANVACRMLGYSNGTITSRHYTLDSAWYGWFSNETDPDLIWMDNVQCSGMETSLADCPFDGWGVENCNAYYKSGHAYVFCYDEVDDSELEVRLLNGRSDGYGNIEVHYSSYWGSVHYGSITYNPAQAQVVCRMLGYSNGTFYSGSSISFSKVTHWMRRQCTGAETNLKDCPFVGFDDTSYSTFGIASALCYNDSQGFNDEQSVYLVDGESGFSGAVEVVYGGQRTSVCGTNWSDVEAKIVCWMLNFRKGTSKYYSKYAWESLEDIILKTNIKCSGSESSIYECTFSDVSSYCYGINGRGGVSCSDPIATVPTTLPTTTTTTTLSTTTTTVKIPPTTESTTVTSKPCPTTSSAPVTRHWRQLYDSCGVQGQDAQCTATNSACMPDSNGLWKCRCIPGFIETGVNCTKLPGRIFSKNERFPTVPTDANIGHTVLTEEFSQIWNICSTKPEVTLFGDDDLFEADVTSCRNVIIRTKSRLPLESSVRNLMVKAKFVDGVNVIMDAIFVTVSIQSSTIVAVLPDMTFSDHFVTSVARGGTLSLSNSDLMRITSAGDVYTKQQLKVADIADEDEVAAILTTKIQRLVDSSVASTNLTAVILRTNTKRRISEDKQNNFVVASFKQLRQSSLNVSVTSVMNNNIFAFDGTVLKIQNAKDLDYDNGQRSFSFSFSVHVTSSIIPVTVAIEVLPTNDNIPEFLTDTGDSTGQYSFTLFPTPISSVVCGAVRARDQDPGSQLTYSLDPQSAMVSYFTVGQHDGIVSTLVRTDMIPFNNNTGASNDQYVTFTVQVRDETVVHTNTSTVTVYLKRTPERNLGLSFTASVFENVSIATSVKEVVQAGYTQYEFASRTGSADFSIDRITGMVSVSQALDRETRDSYRFSVTAIEEKSQTCALVVIGDLTITVLDANDNSPVFGRIRYNGTVDENMPVNSIVKLDFPITATDADLGSFTFRITNSLFAISQSGEISTKQQFDRESVSTYDVAVVADDGKNTNQAMVRVTIGDRNDNNPVFSAAKYSVSISENTKDDNLISVSAADNDAGRNAILSYLLDGGGDSFEIGYKTGVVSVTVPLDRELQSLYRLTVTAIDGGDPPRTSSVSITVIVTDVNDNDPMFLDNSLVITTDEEVQCPSSTIGMLSAIDLDDGDILQYSTSDTRFTVDQNTGDIKCVDRLDYEETQQLKLNVTVSDKGSNPRQTSGTVIVKLKDINDNTPNITHPDTARLQQNDFLVSRPVMVVVAEDKDSGPNGQVTFSLTGADLIVSIDDKGIISTVVGTPVPNTYFVMVKVGDKGDPSRSVTSTVTIQVTANTNVNLKFREQHHKFNVSEEKGPNTVVGDVSQNLDNPNSLTPKYDIPNPSGAFTIDSNTGVLSTKTRLDRETKAEHIVFVRVRADDATTGDLTLVNVSVVDTNDHSPEFFKDKYRLFVSEDRAVDSVITTISVTDKDIGVNAKIYFSLGDGSSSECLLDFNVNERNGHLQVVRGLDYETYINCQFTVLAFDKSSFPLTSSVEVDITIEDVNDNSPSFSASTYQIEVEESFRTETSIFGTVSDADSNENGRVQLSDRNSIVCPFRIKTDTRSLIMTLGENEQLDYETKTSYICVIVATDMASSNPRTSSATVTVSITDVNDNPPIFSSLSYKVNISRDLSPRHNVITVMATDDDSGLNKVIRYDIAGDDGYLDIDSNTGQVSVDKSLYDYRRDIMVITVIATDQAPVLSDRLSSSATLTINIEDGNVRPNFPNSTAYAQLQEETEVIGVFYNVSANDWDGTTNRRCLCTYRLENTSTVFEVDPMLGQIRMRAGTSVDRERDGPSVSLGIIARDQGSPPKDSETFILNIAVLDINDQSPRFRYNNIPTFKIYQTLSTGSEIGTVTSEDLDGSQYSETLYNITDLSYSASGTFSDRNTSIFGLSTIVADRHNGTLRTTRSLELTGQTATFYIMLTVEAVDKNDNSMKDNTPVIVEVKYEDPNQHYPRFSNDVYQTEMPRSHPQTDVVLTVSASDADQPPKNSIKYSITAGNYRDVMTVDTRSGDIKLAYLLDEKFDASNLTLTVRATDSGDIPKYSSISVRITLTGDYQPCFTSAMRTEIVAEKDLFFAVMLGLVGALCIAIVLCFILFYKYRTVDKKLAVYVPSKSKPNDNTYSGLQPESERQHHDYTISGGSMMDGGYEPLPDQGPPRDNHPYSTVPELRGTAEQSHMNPAYSASADDVTVGVPN